MSQKKNGDSRREGKRHGRSILSLLVGSMLYLCIWFCKPYLKDCPFFGRILDLIGENFFTVLTVFPLNWFLLIFLIAILGVPCWMGIRLARNWARQMDNIDQELRLKSSRIQIAHQQLLSVKGNGMYRPRRKWSFAKAIIRVTFGFLKSRATALNKLKNKPLESVENKTLGQTHNALIDDILKKCPREYSIDDVVGSSKPFIYVVTFGELLTSAYSPKTTSQFICNMKRLADLSDLDIAQRMTSAGCPTTVKRIAAITSDPKVQISVDEKTAIAVALIIPLHFLNKSQHRIYTEGDVEIIHKRLQWYGERGIIKNIHLSTLLQNKGETPRQHFNKVITALAAFEEQLFMQTGTDEKGGG